MSSSPRARARTVLARAAFLTRFSHDFFAMWRFVIAYRFVAIVRTRPRSDRRALERSERCRINRLTDHPALRRGGPKKRCLFSLADH